MRTTLNIENCLLQELKDLAHQENISLTRLVNRVLRNGMGFAEASIRPKKPYHEESFDMGKPYINLEKSLAVSFELEDEEILRKIEMRK